MSVTALRRKYLLRLLAQLDQQIAEAEDLASRSILTDGEQEYLAVQLTLRRQWRERVAVRRMVALKGPSACF